MKYSNNRRQFLRSAGGLALSLPFLESLAPSTALAQAQATPIKRFVAIMASNGYMEPAYYPTVEADVKLSENMWYKTLASIPGNLTDTIQKDLDAFRSKMNIYRGLDVPGAFGHTPCLGLASARRLQNGDSSPIDPPGNCRSIDVVLGMSNEFYTNTPKFKALRGAAGWSKNYSLDRDSTGQLIQTPYTLWPKDMLTAVFSGANLSGAEEAALRTKRQTIGDLVSGSMKALLNDRRISSTDKVLVDNYVTQIVELNKRIMANPIACSSPSVPTPRSTYIGSLTEAERGALIGQFVDLMVTAMACDLTRVCVITLEGGNHPHGISHSNFADPINCQNYVDWVRKVELPYVKQMAEKMNSIVEPNGKTMLDNSVIFWGNEQSAGNAHCSTSMPAITLGSMNGAIKTGYYMDYRVKPLKYYASRKDIYPGYGSESYNQLFNTIFKGLGVSPSFYEQFGDGGGFGTCNPEILNYAGTMYDAFLQKRKNTLPFISLV